MRFFIGFLLVISFFQSAYAQPDKSFLTVYIFKGDSLPKEQKVYVKSSVDQKKPQIFEAFMGLLELNELKKGQYFVSVKKKGPYVPVRLVSGERSQISFDLSKKNPFIAKHDDFKEDLDLSDTKLKDLEGTVSSKDSGGAVSGATIMLNGSRISAKTDQKGKFKIQVPEGQDYSLSVIHEDFRAASLGPSDLQGGSSISLMPSMGEMSEVVILAPKTKGSIEDLLKERRKLKTVSVSVGSEQFKKSGDSNAASALKRVSGLSLVEGKYVYVRGLGERYSSTALNGSVLPSPNPSRRVVPLDLFPTSLIESILIQKSYSVDKPAQFSAGFVEVRTVSIPKTKSFFKVSLSTGASNEQILQGDETGFSYKGGSDDAFGFDDGSRELPQAISNLRQRGEPIKWLDPDDWFGDGTGLTTEELADLATSFSNNYNISEDEVGLNYGFSFEGGRSFKMGSSRAGFILKGLYGNNNNFILEQQRSYVLGDEDALVLEREDTRNQTSQRINSGAIFSTGFDLFKRHKIDFTGVGTRSTINRTDFIIRDSLANEEDSFEITRLSWEERELLNFQVKGEHSLFENHKGPKLEWFWARSLSSNYRPDNREYSYYLTTGQFVDRAFGNERSFSDLNDLATDFNLKFSSSVKASPWLKFDFFAGTRNFDKSRRSEVQRFSFIRQGSGNSYNLRDELEKILTPENFRSGEFQIRDSTNLTDNYTANENTSAVFASLGSEFGFSKNSSLTLTAGVRREDHFQDVRTFDIVTGVDSEDASEISQDDDFYSYGAVYKLNPKASFRAGFSETVARPDLQEFAPVIFFNDDENVLEQGNPELEIAEVQNFDLRFDYYFNNREFISVGVFRKDILNPIETVTVIGTEDIRTYQNIEGALNDGFEFEFRKHLFKGLFLSGNYSYIDSQVEISEEEAQASTSLNRPLQGQSPYLVNVGLEYGNKKYGLDTALIYNVAGERISEVGAFGIPDTYEEPFRQLDFTIRKKLNKKLSMSFKAQNLLDPLAQRTQGGLSVREFRYGRSYSINLSSAI